MTKQPSLSEDQHVQRRWNINPCMSLKAFRISHAKLGGIGRRRSSVDDRETIRRGWLVKACQVRMGVSSGGILVSVIQ